MVRWIWAFIDRPLHRFEESAAFWTAVTGTRPSARRGDHGEFATLIPEAGDAYVELQGVFDQGGAHIDLEVEDVSAAVARAAGLGATAVADHGSWVVMRSPEGRPFCLLPWSGGSRRPPVTDGSRLDQVCLDISPSAYDEEVAFWEALTGWPLRQGALPEFMLLRAPGMPIRILLQRLGRDQAPAQAPTAHVDIACADAEATRARHERLGAVVAGRGSGWTVMRDPAGGVYCLTNRDPETGSLPT
jgi:hypothetical protein